MRTVIHDTTIVTADAEQTIHYGQAIAIDGDRIAAIGPNQTIVERFADAERIDGRHRAVMPGLANCHNHLCRVIGRSMSEDRNAPNKPPFTRQSQLPFPLMAPEARKVMARLAVVEAMRSGTTAILEVWSGVADYAEVLAESGLRFLLCEQTSDRARGVRVGEPDAFQADPALAEAGLARTTALHDAWHGAADGRIRVGVSAHAPDMCSPDLLQALAALQEKLDTVATIHLNQYWGEVEGVKKSFGKLPTDYVDAQGFLSERLIAAHCRCMTPEEMDTLGRRGVSVSYNAAVAAQTGMAPDIARLEAAGCTIALGSDEFTEDMVDVLRWALYLERVRRGDGNNPQPEDALRWGTSNGYKALGIEDGGILKEGNKADLILIDTAKAHLVPTVRVVAGFVHNGHPADVHSVMVDGRWVLRDGKVLNFDEASVIAEADRVGRTLWRDVVRDNPGIAPPPGIDRRDDLTD